jgi:CBS domain-containing protein
MVKLLTKDIMTKKVITINENTTLAKLSELLIKNRISGVPVVDENGELTGIITEADIIIKECNLPLPLSFSYTFLEKFESYTKSTKEYFKTRVEEIMSTDVKVAVEDMPISKVVNIMINNSVNRLPVVDDDGKLAGIISRADIIKFMIAENKKK